MYVLYHKLSAVTVTYEFPRGVVCSASDWQASGTWIHSLQRRNFSENFFNILCVKVKLNVRDNVDVTDTFTSM